MEEICKALSQTLGEGGVGGYKVFYEDELLDAIPQSARSRATLESALKRLSDGGYIDIKYARGTAFCLALLRPYETPAPPPTAGVEVRSATVTFPKRFYLYLCLSALTGGVLSGALCALIGAAII